MLATQDQKQLQNEFPQVFEIDGNLDRLIHKIELLSYVNPINVEKEKHRFFCIKICH